MIGDITGLLSPHATRVFEISDEFFLFRVDTNDGFLPVGKAFPQATDMAELQVAFGAPLPRAVAAQSDFLAIRLKGISQFLEHAGHPLIADHNSLSAELGGDFAGGLAGPFESGHGVAGRFVFHQGADALNDLWSFF